jgi:hypothetical protein
VVNSGDVSGENDLAQAAQHVYSSGAVNAAGVGLVARSIKKQKVTEA